MLHLPSLRDFLCRYLRISEVLQRDSGLAARLAHIEAQNREILNLLRAAAPKPEPFFTPIIIYEQADELLREMAKDLHQ